MQDSIIFHVDVNSAFLSFEAHHRLNVLHEEQDIRLIPSIIGGDRQKRHGVVLAKSLPAQKYGIQTGEPIVNALKKCPSLEIYEAHHSLYVEYSNKLMNLLSEYAPNVEPYSIDEAFLDMSGTRLLYGDPVAFAHKLKDIIYETLGFTVNIGISENRLLAKMASDFEKPNRVHTLFLEEIKEKMWPLPVSQLFYVGSSTLQRLKTLGIHTIGDLAVMDEQLLIRHLGKHGKVIHEFANGIDTSLSNHKTEANKGYGNEITLPYDVTDAQIAKTVLLSLSETVAARIRADKAQIGVVCVSITDSSFRSTRKQITLQTHTDITETIYTNATRLFDELWNHEPIRLLGVHTNKASFDACTQYNLFDTDSNEKFQKLDLALDAIRQKFGSDSVKRACFINQPTSEKSHIAVPKIPSTHE